MALWYIISQMYYKRLSSIFLIILMLNLNMVVPGVSYAVAEETCTCHFKSADHQCHHEKGCGGCQMHKKQKVGWDVPTSIKGMTCSTSPQSDNTTLSIQVIPFLVPIFCDAVPTVQISSLSSPIEDPLYGVTLTPSEKPPTA